MALPHTLIEFLGLCFFADLLNHFNNSLYGNIYRKFFRQKKEFSIKIATLELLKYYRSPFIFGEEETRPLSKEGNIEAKKVAKKLRNVRFDQYVSSSYTRAIQTFLPLTNNQKILVFF